MRKYALILVLISQCFLSYGAAHGSDFKKTRIAVLDFQIQGTGFETEDMGKIVAEWLITALVQEGRFDVIERRLLEKVLREQNLGASGVVDTQSASKLGKVLGARIVISGTVIKLSNLTEVNTRLIDVQTGSILAAEKVTSETAMRLAKLINLMATKIIKNFPLEGYVVQRSGKTVIIDLGERAGVKEGMKFIVFKEGNVIKHPKTGEVLDITHIETGKVEVTRLKEKTSTATIIEDSSDQKIEYGQMVRSAVTERKEGEREVGFYTSPPISEREDEKKQAGVNEQLEAINKKIDQARDLKERNDPLWKTLVYESFADLKKIFRGNEKSPEIYLAFAKCYSVNNRFHKATKSLKKALYFKPGYTEALIAKGDIYFDESKRLADDTFDDKAERESYRAKKTAVKSYEYAMNAGALKPETKAMISYKLGELYNYFRDKDKAKEYWSGAVKADAKSDWGKKSQDRLTVLN
jgi:TolB-like protein